MLCSCEHWVLRGGICSSPAPKTAQLQVALGGCSPLSISSLLGLFLLGLDLKGAVKIRKNSTKVFSAISNWDLNPKMESEQGCAALSSVGSQDHPLEREGCSSWLSQSHQGWREHVWAVAGLRGWGMDQELPLPSVAVTCGPWGHGDSCSDLLPRVMARAGMFGG